MLPTARKDLQREWAIDAGDLKVLEAVARLGGIDRAAEALHTVRSNVTVRVSPLEEELGTMLFQRNSQGTLLTAAGPGLLPRTAAGAAARGGP